MKNIILILGILFYSQISNSQENIKTTVIELDLSKPTENSVKSTSNKNKLVFDNKSPLAFLLTNGNPFRYRYVLNYQKVNLFTNETFNPSIDKIKSSQESLSIEKDEDGDGIPDDLDEAPGVANVITDDIILIMQGDLKNDLIKLESDIKNFTSNISNDSKLDIDEFNLNKEGFKETYFEYLLKISEIPSLDSDNSKINENEEEINRLSESIRVLLERLLITKTNSYLLPIDTNGENIDYVEVQLDIYDGDNETPDTYKYKIWVKGGLKIDISGGVYITSLMDNQYYTTDTSDPMDTNKLIYQSDVGSYDFGFGTMVNVSLRGGSWVRPTLNFGALFTSNQKFQMLTGLGLILGKNERLIIHGGLSMGRVNVLRDNYLTDGVTSYDLGSEGTIPTDEKFKFGHFFGITYNFNKPKSDKDTER